MTEKEDMIKNKNKLEFSYKVVMCDNGCYEVKVFYNDVMIDSGWFIYIGSVVSFINNKYRGLYGYNG